MTEDKMEDTIEKGKEFLEELASPDHMSQEEAVEFYESMAAECRDWARLIESEMEEGLD